MQREPTSTPLRDTQSFVSATLQRTSLSRPLSRAEETIDPRLQLLGELPGGSVGINFRDPVTADLRCQRLSRRTVILARQRGIGKFWPTANARIGCSDLDDAGRQCVADQLGATGDSVRFHDPVFVKFHCSRGDVQLCGDLLGRQAVHQ